MLGLLGASAMGIAACNSKTETEMEPTPSPAEEPEPEPVQQEDEGSAAEDTAAKDDGLYYVVRSEYENEEGNYTYSLVDASTGSTVNLGGWEPVGLYGEGLVAAKMTTSTTDPKWKTTTKTTEYAFVDVNGNPQIKIADVLAQLPESLQPEEGANYFIEDGVAVFYHDRAIFMVWGDVQHTTLYIDKNGKLLAYRTDDDTSESDLNLQPRYGSLADKQVGDFNGPMDGYWFIGDVVVMFDRSSGTTKTTVVDKNLQPLYSFDNYLGGGILSANYYTNTEKIDDYNYKPVCVYDASGNMVFDPQSLVGSEYGDATIIGIASDGAPVASIKVGKPGGGASAFGLYDFSTGEWILEPDVDLSGGGVLSGGYFTFYESSLGIISSDGKWLLNPGDTIDGEAPTGLTELAGGTIVLSNSDTGKAATRQWMAVLQDSLQYYTVNDPVNKVD